MRKRFVIRLAALFLIASLGFGAEVVERFRLGAVVEGIAYISSGPLEGKIALIDGTWVYLHDPALGNYEKIFSVADAGFVPYGIAYLSQGPFSGNFLIAYSNNPPRFYLYTTSGTLISPVLFKDVTWHHVEGLTQITTSGSYNGMIAMIRYSSVGEPHITIFQISESDGEIQAWLEKDVILDCLPSFGYAPGIAYLPSEYPNPEFRDRFVVSDSMGSRLYVVDLEGNCEAEFPGLADDEGLAYISSGAYAGNLILVDMVLFQPTIQSLDGTFSVPASIPPVGLGLFAALGLSWMGSRQQFFIPEWDGRDYDIPVSLISRPSAGTWNRDNRFRITNGFRIVHRITDQTADGTYVLFGTVSARGEPAHRGYASVNAALEQFGPPTPFPEDYRIVSPLVYIAGETAAEDRFAAPLGKKIVMFDPFFSPEPLEIDLTSSLTNDISGLCYDPSVRRFYIQDGMTIRVFDRGWNRIDSLDIGGIAPNFSSLTRITSGDLRGHLAGLNSDENELIIIYIEYDLAVDLVGDLIGDVRTVGLNSGLANSLTQKLKNASDLIKKKLAAPAVHLLDAFINEVRARSGTGIPAAKAESWIARAEDVIRGLKELL
jgi:hypothetical protein